TRGGLYAPRVDLATISTRRRCHDAPQRGEARQRRPSRLAERSAQSGGDRRPRDLMCLAPPFRRELEALGRNRERVRDAADFDFTLERTCELRGQWNSPEIRTARSLTSWVSPVVSRALALRLRAVAKAPGPKKNPAMAMTSKGAVENSM